MVLVDGVVSFVVLCYNDDWVDVVLYNGMC